MSELLTFDPTEHPVSFQIQLDGILGERENDSTGDGIRYSETGSFAALIGQSDLGKDKRNLLRLLLCPNMIPSGSCDLLYSEHEVE